MAARSFAREAAPGPARQHWTGSAIRHVPVRSARGRGRSCGLRRPPVSRVACLSANSSGHAARGRPAQSQDAIQCRTDMGERVDFTREFLALSARFLFVEQMKRKLEATCRAAQTGVPRGLQRALDQLPGALSMPFRRPHDNPVAARCCGRCLPHVDARGRRVENLPLDFKRA